MKFRDLLEQIAKEQAEKLSTIDKNVAEIRLDLNYHIKRTDLLEEEFKPVKKHVEIVNALAKILTSIIVLSAALAGIYKTFL